MEHTFLTFLLLFVLLCVAESCDRVFVGSVNESYPDLVHNNGIYRQIGSDDRGLPVYRQEFREIYLYHIGGNLVPGFWAVGPVAGGTDAALSILTSVPNPTLAHGAWKLWDEEERRWKPVPRLRAVCVPDSFVTCTTGRVSLGGLSPWNHHQRQRMGEYVLTNETSQMRPVYESVETGDFLFHYNGLWMVGPEVGRVTAGLFVLDSAWRPEYIVEEWVVFNGHQFVRDQKLRVVCQGEVLPSEEGDEEAGNHPGRPNNIDNTIPGSVPVADPGPLPLCPTDWCYNGGSCIKNGNNTYLCACPEGFFGSRCEEEISCGPPPEVEHGVLVRQTGNGHGAIAFYNCEPDYVMSGEVASVCREDGEWSAPPQCEHRFHQITPSVPVSRSSGLRLPDNRAPRGRRHRRSVADITIDVDTLKELLEN